VDVSGVYIQQAAAMVGTTSASLRMWEKYDLVKPRRTPSGYRIYSLDEIERLREVQHLLQDGVNPAGILKIFDEGSRTPAPAAKSRDESRRARCLGDTVRDLRRRSGLTLRQVSDRTGLSPSYISSVERSLASPSIASLQKFAGAFDTNVPALMSGSDEAPESPLVRVGDRRVLHSDKGVTIEDMSTAGSNLEPLIFTVQPGAGSDGPLSHEGEEFLYVMTGELVLRLDGTDDFTLAPGDSMAYASPRPHQFSNVGREPVVVLWINTPRTF
jgi:DNA-binding transcriptional MerR regulator/mannose-6-phosphate isomerase-like protein (cupin superfamily)